VRWFRNAIEREITRGQKLVVLPGSRVLVIGPRAKEILEELKPSEGVACERPDMIGRPLAPFDYIIISQLLPQTEDLIRLFDALVPLTSHRTRLLVDFYNYNFAWQLVLRVIQIRDIAGPRTPTWIASKDVSKLLGYAGFEVVTEIRRMMLPTNFLILDGLFNRFLAKLPLLSRFDLLTAFVCRRAIPPARDPSVTIVVTCKNERANIEPTALRIPRMGSRTTILFVEGGSTDGTPDEIDRVIRDHPDRDIRHVTQKGKGQGDAMHTGFRLADTDFIIQFDSDLTIDPEQIEVFYRLLSGGLAEYIMATRAVYPMEDGAMRLLNRFANWFFGLYFSWILGQRLTDTLGGVKAFRREDYPRIIEAKKTFGDLDPFGDFDLLFGAIKNGLRVGELPVRYRARTYGTTQINRFRDGARLLRMSAAAMWKYQFHG
jgi:hypothetical protein